MVDFKKRIAQMVRGVYGWTIEKGEAIPPKYEFPLAMKNRVEYFQDLSEDIGVPLMNVLEWIFAYDEEECKRDYESIFIGNWLPLDKESRKWIESTGSLGQKIVAVALIYGVYDGDSEESGADE